MDDWPTVELTASGVVPFPLDLCWAITRDFGAIGKVWDGMGMAGQSRRVRSRMLEDVPGTCVGGYRRLEVGDMILVQQLDAIDDEEHKLKYHAVDHPMNRWDPPGSFVNDGWTISMKPVSLGNMTHIHMTGKFLTEPEHVRAMSSFIMEMCNGVVTGVDSYLTRAEAAGMLRPRGPQHSWPQTPCPAPHSYHQQQYQAHQMSNAAQHATQGPVGMNNGPLGMNSPLLDGFAARASHTMHHAQQAVNGMGHNMGYSPPSNANLRTASSSYPMPHAQGVPNAMGYGTGYPSNASAQFQPPHTGYPMHHGQQVPRSMPQRQSAEANARRSAAQAASHMYTPFQQVPEGTGANPSMAAQRSPNPNSRPSQASPTAGPELAQGSAEQRYSAVHLNSMRTHAAAQHQADSSSGLDRGADESRYTAVRSNSMRAHAAAQHQADGGNVMQRSASLTADEQQPTWHESYGSDASSSSIPRPPCSTWPSGMSASGVSAAQLGTSQPGSLRSSPANSYTGSLPSPMHHTPKPSQFLQQASLQRQQSNGSKLAGGLVQAGPSAYSNAEQSSQPHTTHADQHMSSPGQQTSFPVQQTSFPVQQMSHPGQQMSSTAQQMNFPGQQMSHPGQQMGRPGQKSAAMLSSTWDNAQQQPDTGPQQTPQQIPQQTRRRSQTRHQAQQMRYPSHCMPAGNWGTSPHASPDFLPPHQVGFDGLQMPGLAQAMGQMKLDQGLGGPQARPAR